MQASAEQFEDRLKGLLDRAEQTSSDQQRQGGGDVDNRPVRKRQKLLGDYNQAYDEVLVVDEGGNEPEEERPEAKDEQFEEIDPKDISR